MSSVGPAVNSEEMDVQEPACSTLTATAESRRLGAFVLGTAGAEGGAATPPGPELGLTLHLAQPPALTDPEASPPGAQSTAWTGVAWSPCRKPRGWWWGGWWGAWCCDLSLSAATPTS